MFYQKINTIISRISGITNIDKLTDIVAEALPISLTRKLEYLYELSSTTRVKMILDDINQDMEIVRLEEKIEEEVSKGLEESQKEFVLREKMKVIKEELGELDSKEEEIEELEYAISELKCPLKVKNRLISELERYKSCNPNSPEVGMIRNYIDWLLDLPWSKRTRDKTDLNQVKKILDNTHSGLDNVKSRIIEYLAVKQNTNNLRSPIICLVGPPGVGKTTLAKSIADSINRKFTKISVGGVNDEGEIVGHRRTYLGAAPGLIIQGMKKASTINPVSLIDEIDKLTKDVKGDPASSLLEVLDKEQNQHFVDHYIEEEFDLSEVLFVATANYIDKIPDELKDRLEVVELSSYTEYEKLDIAKDHLIKNQMQEHGLPVNKVKFSDEAILSIIRNYTKESGVRELDRLIATILRKIVKEIVMNKVRKTYEVSEENIENYLGPIKYSFNDTEDDGKVGVVNASCPSITVSGYGTYDLETYIAGVLAAEPGATMVNDELGKYNAIIIRSFTLAHTNNCTKSITSSSNEQNFTNSTQYKKYADETAGIVMTKPDGKIIEAVYSLARASDCIPTNGKCKFKRCTDYAESVSSCPGKVTEFIVPYGTITYQGSDIHYGGSEPYLAKYLATKENYTYDKLLKAFYGDDMSLARLSSSAASSTSTTTTSSSDELCGNGDNSKYWWPSGSKQTETSGGKVYAKGDPESTTITNGFGCGGENAWRTTGCHGGLDIGVNCGSNIIAAKSGTVVNTSDGCPTYGSYGSSCGGGYGNYIILQHSDGNYTLYGHLSQNGVKVKQGDTVDQGQVIAASGSSGSSTGCHLHFEVRKGANTGDARDDPLNYVDPKNPRPKGGDFKHVKGDSVKQEVCLSLKASGYSNNGVAAVLGNMVAESSFDPNVVGDNGTSYGLCQWHEGRWESLKKFTSEWKTVPGQLQYLLHELKTSYSGLNESLISGSSSAYDLTNRYCTQFEVPADTESTCAARASSNASSMSSYVNNNCK